MFGKQKYKTKKRSNQFYCLMLAWIDSIGSTICQRPFFCFAGLSWIMLKDGKAFEPFAFIHRGLFLVGYFECNAILIPFTYIQSFQMFIFLLLLSIMLLLCVSHVFLTLHKSFAHALLFPHIWFMEWIGALLMITCYCFIDNCIGVFVYVWCAEQDHVVLVPIPYRNTLYVLT